MIKMAMVLSIEMKLILFSKQLSESLQDRVVEKAQGTSILGNLIYSLNKLTHLVMEEFPGLK